MPRRATFALLRAARRASGGVVVARRCQSIASLLRLAGPLRRTTLATGNVARHGTGAVAAVLLMAATGPAASAAAGDQPQRIEQQAVFSFADEEITESSGLVDAGRLLLTVNDSGDEPVIYAVDERSGATVAVTTYSQDEVEDVEAIAPGDGGAVWVGDIGDNDEERSTIDVYRAEPLSRPGPREEALAQGGQTVSEEVAATRYSLVYPDEAHNAETLLVHPDTGRVYVVTKELTGGVVFAAPQSLDPDSDNQLEEVGRVPGYLTDGTFFPDGRHVMLRGYGGAAVFTFPEFRLVGSMRLPPQRLGEGLAIADDGQIYLSSEGVFAEVLRILLPPDVAAAVGEERPRTLPVPSASPVPPDQVARPPDELSTGDGPLLWAAAGTFVVVLAGWLAFTVSRRRSRRTR